MFRSFLFFLTVVYCLGGLPSSAHAQRSVPSSLVARQLSNFLPRQHMSHHEMDDGISFRAWNNYLAALDFERIFFLQSDIERLQRYTNRLDNDLMAGDVSFAFLAYEIFKERMSNRVEHVGLLLNQGFDLNVVEDYKWKRTKEPWPASQEEQDEIWRKRIKNEYIRMVVAEELKDPAEKIEANSTSNTTSAAIIPTTPEESIKKRYQQLFTTITDSDSDNILQRYFTSVANAFDPHSSYFSPTSLEDFNIEMKLSLVGVGALLQSDEGAAKIVRIIPGGPADRDPEKRLQPGDKIIAVAQDGKPFEDVVHLPLNKIVQKIRGKKGTKVILTVIPASDPSGSTTKTIDLIRDEVKLEEQAVKHSVLNIEYPKGTTTKLAVITVPTFYASMKSNPDASDYRSCADDVEAVLNSFSTNPVDGVVLDLRNNGGGSLIEAIRMTGLFITRGPVVQVKDEESSARALSDDDSRIAYEGPLVALVNRLSASASEILAGALQDYGRAIIVGDSKTHGKGTVQTILNLSRNPSYGAVKLTTAVFYRLNGNSTQIEGVAPDIVIPSPFEFMDLGEENLDYAMEWTALAPLPHRVIFDSSEVIEQLKERSLKRRSADERFCTYDMLLKHVESIYKAETLPLDIERRRAMAQTEKEIADLQKKFTPDSQDTEDEKNSKIDVSNDIVLEESLKILADFAPFWNSNPKQQMIVKKKKAGFLQNLADWLREQR